MAIRRAGAEDAAAVLALSRAAYAQWVPLIGREPKPMTADYAQAIRAHRVDLYEVDGVLEGLIELIVEPDHLLVENVAVRPGGQRRGLGAALMLHAEAVAAGLGLDEIRLYTNRAFVSNIEFYGRRGYVVTGRQAFPAGGEIVFMAKRLGSLPP